MLRKNFPETKIFSGFLDCFSFMFSISILLKYFLFVKYFHISKYFHEEITQSEWSPRTGGLDGGKS